MNAVPLEKPTEAEADKENGDANLPAAKRRGRPAGRVGKSPDASPADTKTLGAFSVAETSPEPSASAIKNKEEDLSSGGRKNTRSTRAKARGAAAEPAREKSNSPSPVSAQAAKTPAPPASAARKAVTVIEIDLVSPESVRNCAKTPACDTRNAVCEPSSSSSSRGPTTRSASKSVSETKKAGGCLAAASGRSALGVPPKPAAAVPDAALVDDVAATPVTCFTAKTPRSGESGGKSGGTAFGKKLLAVANVRETENNDAPAVMDADVPLFSNSLFEQSLEKEPQPVEMPEAAPVAAEEPEPAPPPVPKLAPDLMTSFVPLAGYEEKPVAVVSEAREKLADSVPVPKPPPSAAKPASDGKLKALQLADAARKADSERETERRARKEGMMAARVAAANSAKPVVAAPKPAAAAAGVIAGGAAAGSVMERLQRAMESRARLEAENRSKLDLVEKQKEQERVLRETELETRRMQKEESEVREKGEKKARALKMQTMREETEAAQREVEEKQLRVLRLVEEQEHALGRKTAAGGVTRGASEQGDGPAQPGALDSADEKKRRLLDFVANNRANAALAAKTSNANGLSTQERHTTVAGGTQTHAASTNGTVVSAPSVAAATPVVSAPSRPAAPVAAQVTPAPRAQPAPSLLHGAPSDFSYQISPYRENSDSESEEDESGVKKPIPGWATSENLAPCLYRQAKIDPDSIFVNPEKTCSLDAVFTTKHKTGKSRRSSSSNWFHDRLTWKEEVSYKREMGFVTNGAHELA